MRVSILKTPAEWDRIKELAKGKSFPYFITLELHKQINHSIPCAPSAQEEGRKKIDYNIPTELQQQILCLADKLNISVAETITRLAINPHLDITQPEG